MSKVLVTGGSGFVAGHCLAQLLVQGHEVRTTLRDLKRESEIRETLKNAGIQNQTHLSFCQADLTEDKGWSEAVNGCDFVLHVASPFPKGAVKDENEIVVPARDGALRVLRAARDAQVKRVVMTSSFAAIGYGYPENDRQFTESDWANTTAPLPAYIKSKAVAEKAAWEFIKSEGRRLELTVICPTGVFGPILNSDLSGSIEIVRSMLNGQMPSCPKIYFGVVDVRDVAALHILAMTEAKAAGERFIVTCGDVYSLFDVAKTLRKTLGDKASLAPGRELPSWLVRVMAKFIPKLRGTLQDLDKKRHPSNRKAVDVFNWKFREFEQAIADTGKSLIAFNLVEPSKP